MMELQEDQFCTECSSSPAIQIGEPLDWESRTIYICSKCLKKAIKLLDHGVSNEPKATS